MSLSKRLGLSDNPIFLMDGSAYIFRSFYAHQNMSRADGTPTNVLFMVLRMLFKILREENPAWFAFVLDGKGKNFRHRLYGEYKAHREATPEPLAAQIAPLCEAVRTLGFFLTISDDCEADDCIASLSARLSKEHPVVIIGADKDLKQCLAPNVYIWDPAKDERITSLQSFSAEFGFEPRYWPDYQAIVGDSSDNIPGVSGIGAKGAGTLLREFKGLEDIFSRMAAVPPPLRKKLEGKAEAAYFSRKLTTLRLDTCADITLDQLTPVPIKQKELLDFLAGYELRSLARELASMLRIQSAQKQSRPQTAPTDTNALSQRENTPQDAEPKPRPDTKAATTLSDRQLPSPQKTAPAEMSIATLPVEQASLLDFSADFEQDAGKADTALRLKKLPGFTGAMDIPDSPVLAIIFARDLTQDKADRRLLIGDGASELLFDPDAYNAAEHAVLGRELLAGLNGKMIVATDFKALCENYTVFSALSLSLCFDLSLAAWLLNPEEYDYGFKKLQRLWGAEALAFIAEWNPGQSSGALPSSLALAMHRVMQDNLKANNLLDLLNNLEMPLIPVLLDMQKAGLGIDIKAFSEFLQETESELIELSKKIYSAAGHEFNIRSAKQLGDILFNELKLPKPGKTQGGQLSTSQEALEKLKNLHPLVTHLLEYRKLEKLRSTYLEPLPRLTDSQGRLHTSFNQSATVTGRLSSSNPNLQNIPVRGPQGTRMRACFVAKPGKVLVSADYSQIELRVLAHLSQDPTLLDAFSKNEDIHRRTASLLFDKSQDSITADERRSAKTINFGLIYGMGPQKLAQELGINTTQAKAFITRYFAKLGKLREYFEQVETAAKKYGFVSTMTGRRRPCPDILSENQQLRSRARRQAINTCIQGTAADIIKLAMLDVSRDMELKTLGARLILQIHDELIVECAEVRASESGERLSTIMAAVKPGGQTLSVPLICDWGSGISWAQAH
ncbi:MAG: DNA polymerase I [Deltaproteobacteria bacterium]|jgi:DNA polymerase-1|nr:DNA polymerase I [Deltaproteobacteria bacterium]